jgi:hypothetical protein
MERSEMSIFYEMSGSFEVTYCPEVEDLIEKFHAESGEIEIKNLTEGVAFGETAVLQVHGMTNCTYSTSNELDEIIREFSPYVTAPAAIYWNTNDGDDGDIYLGPEGSESACTLEEIKGLVVNLTKGDLEKLTVYLQDVHSHSKH